MIQFYKKPYDQRNNNNKASVVFNLDKSGNIDVQFLWPELETMNNLEIKDLSKNYSALISIINLGGFKADIYKILLQSQKQTSCASDRAFISEVLTYLIESDNISSGSMPMVAPTKVFKKYE